MSKEGIEGNKGKWVKDALREMAGEDIVINYAYCSIATLVATVEMLLSHADIHFVLDENIEDGQILWRTDPLTTH